MVRKLVVSFTKLHDDIHEQGVRSIGEVGQSEKSCNEDHACVHRQIKKKDEQQSNINPQHKVYLSKKLTIWIGLEIVQNGDLKLCVNDLRQCKPNLSWGEHTWTLLRGPDVLTQVLDIGKPRLPYLFLTSSDVMVGLSESPLKVQ